MDDPTPASFSMRTRCPASLSSLAPCGVKATRYSSVLISLATPMIIVDHTFTRKRLLHATANHLEVDVVHHVFDARVVLEAIDREILAVPRLLKSPVGHLGHQRNVRVDPHAAKVKVSRQSHRPSVIAGPDRRGQSVLHAIGPLQGLGFVGEFLHGDDRSKYFALDHLVVLKESRHDSRFEKEAVTTHLRPTRHQGGVLRGATQE